MYKISFIMLFLPTAAFAGFFGPSNFDECMVDKMKGQDPIMYSNVQKLCINKFERELPNYASKIKYEWGLGLFGLNITIKENRGKYGLTKLYARFSEKPCKRSIEKDYSEEIKFDFNGHRLGSALAMEAPKINYQCIRIQRIFGVESPK